MKKMKKNEWQIQARKNLMNKLIQTLTGITIGILFIICMMSCSQKSYPGYAKYKKYEKRIDCPANQMIKERRQKIFWYKIWH